MKLFTYIASILNEVNHDYMRTTVEQPEYLHPGNPRSIRTLVSQSQNPMSLRCS